MYLLGPSCKYWQLFNIHSKDISQVVVLTDSLSVLAVLCNCKLPLLSRTQGQVIQTRHMTFRRVPAHVEQVDMDILVAKSDQPQLKISYGKEILWSRLPRKTKCRTANNDYHFQNRQDQLTIFRLYAGHNMLNAHTYSKFRLSQSPQCSHGIEQLTTEHELHQCPLLMHEPKNVWPVSFSLHRKLY